MQSIQMTSPTAGRKKSYPMVSEHPAENLPKRETVGKLVEVYRLQCETVSEYGGPVILEMYADVGGQHNYFGRSSMRRISRETWRPFTMATATPTGTLSCGWSSL